MEVFTDKMANRIVIDKMKEEILDTYKSLLDTGYTKEEAKKLFEGSTDHSLLPLALYYIDTMENKK
jgi:hypothetical protein